MVIYEEALKLIIVISMKINLVDNLGPFRLSILGEGVLSIVPDFSEILSSWIKVWMSKAVLQKCHDHVIRIVIRIWN